MFHAINSCRLSHYAGRAFLTTVAAVLLSLLSLPEAAADRRAVPPPAPRSATPAATIYYVAPYGDDNEMNPGTELTQPLATIAEAVKRAVHRGDKVLVRQGVYELKKELVISASGEPDAWITIRSYPGETAVIDGSKLPPNSDTVVIGGRHVEFSAFEVRNSSRTGIVVWGGRHVRITGNVVHNCVRGGIWVGHDQVGSVRDISIDGNTVYDTCLVNSMHTVSGGWPGAIVSEKANNIAISNNNVFHNHGEGIIFLLTDHGRASGNVVYDNFSVGMYLDNARFCVFDKNLIYSTGDTTYYRNGHPAVGIAAANEIYDIANTLSDNTIINNIVIGVRFGFEYYNFGAGGGMKNCLVANNTFYKGTAGIIKVDNHPDHYNNTFANNIFYQVGGATTAVVAPNPANHFHHNCWHGGGIWPSGPGDVNADPKLVNPGSYAAADYQLRPDSPCIATGETITGVNDDHLGRARVPPYDIGALRILSDGVGLQFYPLAVPVRLLDTRPGASPNACSQPNSPINGGTARLQSTRNFCGIPANAQAITGNVTTVQSGGGFLTLYPSGATRPTVASTNYNVNEIVNNVFTVGLGADGAFNIYALNTTDVVVDVSGYYAPPGAGGLYFHPLPAPVRLLETRAGFPVGCVKPGVPLVGGMHSLQTAITACTGIPAAARSVVGNATTIGPAGAGYLTLYPADIASAPLVANSNYNTGQIINGPFTTGLSASGQFKIFTTQTTDLVVDLVGYYSTEANDVNGAGLYFIPLPKPVRLLATRPGEPVGCFKPGVQLVGGAETTQAVRGVCDGVTIPVNTLSVVGNATVVAPSGQGFLTVWPSTAPRPLVATANYNAGDIRNRHFIVGLGQADGAFKLFPLATMHLVIDLSGYFAP